MSGVVPVGLAILLATLTITVVALLFKVSDLQADRARLSDALARLQRDVYQYQDLTSAAFRLLGLEWAPGNPPGWRKP